MNNRLFQIQRWTSPLQKISKVSIEYNYDHTCIIALKNTTKTKYTSLLKQLNHKFYISYISFFLLS